MDNELAPIILFVFNRLSHTKATVESLKANLLSEKSRLYIFSDKNKDKKDEANVNDVRNYIRNITGFTEINIVEREENWGLAKSIIEGVTDIVNKHKKVIVLEDDIVTSPYFLRYMNDALSFYEKEEKVWHISGWNYPLSKKHSDKAFLWRGMNCWGWGTWQNRWEKFEKDTDKLISQFSKPEIRAFNIDGFHNFWGQVLENKSNKINTWAIYWYASIFVNKGLCLNPELSLVHNTGFDGSGTNCKAGTAYSGSISQCQYIIFPEVIEENKFFLRKIKTIRIVIKMKELFSNLAHLLLKS